MKERQSIVVTGLVSLMLVAWLGFAAHRSPRFAGSPTGGVLAVGGSLLMLVPLAYMVAKRIRPLRAWVTKRVSMRTLLSWHIYAGIAGPILVLLHTGHKFESPLGIALTTMTLVVALSGFIGRFLLAQVSQEIREKRALLSHLEREHREIALELRRGPVRVREIGALSSAFARLAALLFIPRALAETAPLSLDLRAVHIAESMADLEYAIHTHETFKRIFSNWLKLHIVMSALLYLLLAAHIWSAFLYGLRWFS